jgi:hypothetical protein
MPEMEKKGVKTIHNEPSQAWEVIWNELRRAGIFKGEVGPVDGSIRWGDNASRAIQRLQSAKLTADEVINIGLLLQAAIHAAEVYWRPGDLTSANPPAKPRPPKK